MTRWLKLPPGWVLYGIAVIVAAPFVALYFFKFLASSGPNYPKRTIPVEARPLTPFHHQLAQAGRWDISKEVAALIPKEFDEAAKFVSPSASPHSIVRIYSFYPGIYPLGPNAEEEAATKADQKSISRLRAHASHTFPDRELLRGTAFMVRLDGTETATFDSFVFIYLYEPADGGVLVSARRNDGTAFYPL